MNMPRQLRSTRVSAMEGVGVSRDRNPTGLNLSLPPNTTIVSADGHWAVADDIWFAHAPAHIRDRLPRIWYDENLQLWNIGIGGKGLYNAAGADVIKSFEDRAGAHALRERLADLDADGVEKEIVFPQVLQAYFHHPDYEAREWIFRIYNDYLADLGRQSLGRFCGVGVPNFWDPDKAADSIQHIKDIGLKTYMIPINPGRHEDGAPIIYASKRMAPFWSAAEKAGLPISYHIGESLGFAGPGGLAIQGMINFTPFRRSFAELVFGGILDRHPGLRVVFAEAGINWVPGVLQDAEMFFDTYEPLLDPRIAHRPTHYWQQHCHATFIADKVGLEMIDYIGVENVMWSTDYPHNEGTLGYASPIVEALLAAVPPDDASKILGGNAIRVFGLN
ncbi:amidohydrolase [Rhizorhabdus wittichii DC-6]|uniref:Amidohydrolase n=2 Tax=Rhizorhabdus wittichii TaxID=160791 RepID=A0A975HDQ2_9SPHN|nr:amidohydrolase [Rhizorhabdus wittichii DC-6]QTH21567.1 amidohydrolase [Rhizorhabdus wittichii]